MNGIATLKMLEQMLLLPQRRGQHDYDLEQFESGSEQVDILCSIDEPKAIPLRFCSANSRIITINKQVVTESVSQAVNVDIAYEIRRLGRCSSFWIPFLACYGTHHSL